MVCFPNAKINIGLNVTEKRSDGFHNIQTVFYPINISDSLEFVENASDKINFEYDGINIEGNSENNLVVRAYRLLQNKYSLPGVDIFLYKNIPTGAGLGGGSSDAAFMLKMINEYFNLKLNNSELKNFASELGSDCAFFIDNIPVYAQEKGDVFSEIELNLSEYYIYLVKPSVNINTKEAYQGIFAQKPQYDLKSVIKQNLSEWKNVIKNDFEMSVFIRYSELENIKNIFYRSGAIYSSMSGSGSAIYAVFKSKPEEIAEFKNYFSFISKL